MRTTILFLGTTDGLVTYTSTGPMVNRTAHILHGQTLTAISALDAETLLVSIAEADALQSFDGGRSWQIAAYEPTAILCVVSVA